MSFFNSGNGFAMEAYDRASEKTIVFTMSSELDEDSKIAHIRTPISGKILGIEAICEETGITDTLLKLEKSNNMVDWIPLSSENTLIKANGHYSSVSDSVEFYNVKKGDVLRIRIIQAGLLSNLTINVKIKEENY